MKIYFNLYFIPGLVVGLEFPDKRLLMAADDKFVLSQFSARIFIGIFAVEVGTCVSVEE